MSATHASSSNEHLISIFPAGDTSSIADSHKANSLSILISRGGEAISSLASAVKKRIWKRYDVRKIENESPVTDKVENCYKYVTERWKKENPGTDQAISSDLALQYLQEGISEEKAEDESKVFCYSLNIAGTVQKLAKELEAKKEIFGLTELPEGLTKVRDLKELFKILEGLTVGKEGQELPGWRNVKFDCTKSYDGAVFAGPVPKLDALNDLLRWTKACENMKARPLNLAIDSVRDEFLARICPDQVIMPVASSVETLGAMPSVTPVSVSVPADLASGLPVDVAESLSASGSVSPVSVSVPSGLESELPVDVAESLSASGSVSHGVSVPVSPGLASGLPVNETASLSASVPLVSSRDTVVSPSLAEVVASPVSRTGLEVQSNIEDPDYVTHQLDAFMKTDSIFTRLKKRLQGESHPIVNSAPVSTSGLVSPRVTASVSTGVAVLPPVLEEERRVPVSGIGLEEEQSDIEGPDEMTRQLDVFMKTDSIFTKVNKKCGSIRDKLFRKRA
ncbi:MAG: hypothetical protein ACI8RA_002645 [Chlamydiales bacterium]|jgi:hypothetical protein